MIAYFYTISYIGAALGLVGWFILQENKIGTTLRNLFFLALIGYLVSWWFAPSSMVYKLQVLARDFGVLAMVGGLFGAFRQNRFVAAAAFAALVTVGGMYYLEILNNTFPSKNRIDDYVTNTIKTDNLAESEYLIEIREGHSIEELDNIIEEYGITYQLAFSGLTSPEITDLDDYYLIDIPETAIKDIFKIRKAFEATETVEWLEDNEIMALDDQTGEVQNYDVDFAPNDPYVNNQWGFAKEQVGELHFLLKDKNIKPVKRAKIAILDTGVDAQHEDIKDNFVSIKSKYDTDKQSHGTHCAGIAAGVTGNNIGIASVIHDNQFVQVTSVKVLNDYGRGTQQTIINGILEAADNGADVISMSLGGVSNDSRQRAYKKAIKYANKKGAIVIAAAGNSRMNAKDYTPAGVEGVIAVSAVDVDLNKAVFSNFVSDVKMGIAAPGVNIFSTIPGNKYSSFNGTSMACPHVAGLVGLMRSINPDLNTKEAFDILTKTGVDTKDLKNTGKFIQPVEAIKEIL